MVHRDPLFYILSFYSLETKARSSREKMIKLDIEEHLSPSITAFITAEGLLVFSLYFSLEGLWALGHNFLSLSPLSLALSLSVFLDTCFFVSL